MTNKLYWHDSHLTKFTARILEQSIDDGRPFVILDQTAFYPTGGGQPCDTGTIGSERVVGVTMADDGTIRHFLDAPIHSTGDVVNCEIDWARRLELTQQHTGQHILSQAFFQLFGAETRGFRINPQSSEIDLTLDAQTADVPRYLQQAEDLANSIIFAYREIRTHLVTPDEAANLPLRKETFVTDCVRVIEIANYDWSACGGTHAQNTGEVGLIVVKHWERAKQMIRAEFLCGVRVARDYRAANAVSELVARQFSVGRDAAPDSVARLIEENKQLNRRLRLMAETAVKYEAHELLQSAPAHSGQQMIVRIFEDRSFDELKLLAHQLVKTDSVNALLAVKESNLARLVFARSANAKADMGTLMREACQLLGGKGGGTSDFAQGGAANLNELENVLKLTSEKIG
jgi:alanyl-tRNA synthetase